MPTIELTALESKVAELAIQKRDVQRAFADAQFAGDVKLIADAHAEIPKDAAVNFHVENGKGTVTWPDVVPSKMMRVHQDPPGGFVGAGS